MKGILLNDFFEITSQDVQENCLKTTVKINAKHRIFDGHFPDRPITPGVCIIQMAKEILMKKFNHALQIKVGNNLKFMNPINPFINDTVDIDVDYKRDGNALSCQIIVKDANKCFGKFSIHLAQLS